MRVAGAGLLHTDEVIVTAGGSDFFDQVVAHLSAWEELDQPVRLVLRSGCYISHDSGKYHRLSPLDGRALGSEPLRLENALMDQHAFLRFGPDVAIATGDIVTLDSDHPCSAFDKSPFIPLVDRDNNVVDAIRTFF